MGILNMFGKDETEETTTPENGCYTIKAEDTLDESGSGKMILLEPRAHSESSQIIDYLKLRNAVVVNLKRLTAAQAKRTIDVLKGAIYAMDGKYQKIGDNTYLLTPNNISIEGQISDETEKKETDKDELEW